jgi:hypothetical protein
VSKTQPYKLTYVLSPNGPVRCGELPVDADPQYFDFEEEALVRVHELWVSNQWRDFKLYKDEELLKEKHDLVTCARLYVYYQGKRQEFAAVARNGLTEAQGVARDVGAIKQCPSHPDVTFNVGDWATTKRATERTAERAAAVARLYWKAMGDMPCDQEEFVKAVKDAIKSSANGECPKCARPGSA